MSKFKKPKKNKNCIIISLGDPAGIGTEITLKALGSKRLNKNIKPLLVGCKNNIIKTYLKLIDNGINNIPDPKNLLMHTDSNFRESRDEKGKLNFKSGGDRIKEIYECEIFDLNDQRLKKIKNLFDKS